MFGFAMIVPASDLRCWSIAAAGSTISIVLWVSVGFRSARAGFLADRTKRPREHYRRQLHRGRDIDGFASAAAAPVVLIIIALGLIRAASSGRSTS